MHPTLKLIIGLLLLALGVLGAVSLGMKEIPLVFSGEHSTGVVKKVETITTSTSSKWEYRNGRKVAVGRGGESTFMTVAFSTKDGKAMEVRTLATFNTAAKVGDQHEMIYLPSRPETAKIYSARQLWLPLSVGLIFTTACLSGAFFMLRCRAVS